MVVIREQMVVEQMVEQVGIALLHIMEVAVVAVVPMAFLIFPVKYFLAAVVLQVEGCRVFLMV